VERDRPAAQRATLLLLLLAMSLVFAAGYGTARLRDMLVAGPAAAAEVEQLRSENENLRIIVRGLRPRPEPIEPIVTPDEIRQQRAIERAIEKALNRDAP
jgi:arginine/ornithine N-succinyltransferase beta subunit